MDDILMDDDLVRLYDTMSYIESLPKWGMPCLLVRTALATGARAFELQAMQVIHINTANNPPVIFIPHGKGPRKNGQMGRPRYVTVIPEFTEHLRRHMASLNGDGQPNHYLFWYRKPLCPVSKMTIERWWQYVVWEQAGLPHIPIHQGARATYATWEADRPVPIMALAKNLGHSVKVCEKYYQKQLPGRLYPELCGPPAWREAAAR